MSEKKQIPGVRPRTEKSIEIDFIYRGVRYRERVRLAPTPKNLKYVANWKARIEHEIATNTFDFTKHFPESKRYAKIKKKEAEQPRTAPQETASQHAVTGQTLEQFLNEWLAIERGNLKNSTYLGYQKIIHYHLAPTFWALTAS